MVISFSNISAANGWAMFVVGYVTVIVALAVLATLISLMPKIIVVQEALNPFKNAGAKAHGKAPKAAPQETEKAAMVPKDNSVLDVSILTTEYGALIQTLPASFELKDVYALAKESDLEHPYMSVKALQEAGKIVPEGEGTFKWNA